ncbi:hypothetical protein BY996DRAFT_6614163 [Phakopsora pachyrhizi]|nr:hypothetical protein BY996DRAFT_6614163 [Phakopsora pachyrhizi]
MRYEADHQRYDKNFYIRKRFEILRDSDGLEERIIISLNERFKRYAMGWEGESEEGRRGGGREIRGRSFGYGHWSFGQLVIGDCGRYSRGIPDQLHTGTYIYILYILPRQRQQQPSGLTYFSPSTSQQVPESIDRHL